MTSRVRLAVALAALLLLIVPAAAQADGYRINVATIGNGFVTGEGFNCGPIHEPVCSLKKWESWDFISLTATPSPTVGWRFSHWSLSGNVVACDGGSVSNPCEFTLPLTCACPRVQEVTAVFVRVGQPATTLTGGPPSAVVGPGTYSFSFTAEPGASFKCRAWQTDAVPPPKLLPVMTPCASPAAVTSTAEGTWRFDVRAVDTFGANGPIASHTWEVDATAPETSLNRHPKPEEIGPQAVFEFSSTDTSATFECKLDSPDKWEDCSSAQELTPGEGEHTFMVRARDPSGNIETTPEAWSWEQEIPPVTTIDEAPLDKSLSNKRSARFVFRADEAVQGFLCKLDGADWTACSPPVELTGLTEGPHTFLIKALDRRLNLETSARGRSWTVDTVAPQTAITEGPSQGAKTSEQIATFALASEPGARLECALDGAGFARCPIRPDGRVRLDRLGIGVHRYRIRAVDKAGNADPTPAERRWTVVADADGDGYNRDKDCRDRDPAIHPGAVDVPDNGVDEDCDGHDAINLDRDGDGAQRGLDCDDADPARRPGAHDVPANGIDEDCSGRDADYPIVSAGISYQWLSEGARAWPNRLLVTKVLKGSTVRVKCKGKGCPFKSRKLEGTGKDLDLKKLFKSARLKRGVRLTIRVTAPGMTTKIVSFKVRKGKAPRGGKFRCRRPGETATIACPAA